MVFRTKDKKEMKCFKGYEVRQRKANTSISIRQEVIKVRIVQGSEKSNKFKSVQINDIKKIMSEKIEKNYDHELEIITKLINKQT